MNGLLIIYIGETAYVWIDTIKHFHDMDARLKKEGYKFVGKKHFGFADVLLGGVSALAMSIPLFNLVIPASHFDKEKSYDEYKNMLLDSGAIEEPEKVVEATDKSKESMFNSKDSIEKAVDKVFSPPRRSINPPNDEDDLQNGKTYKKTK